MLSAPIEGTIMEGGRTIQHITQRKRWIAPLALFLPAFFSSMHWGVLREGTNEPFRSKRLNNRSSAIGPTGGEPPLN